MYVQFRRDGRLLLGTSNDNAVRIWSSENDQPKVRCAPYDGCILKNTHWLMNPILAQLTLTGHIGNVWTASFMAERQHIASASHDRTVKIWDAERGTCIRTIFAHSSVNDLCLADDSGYDRCRVFGSNGLYDQCSFHKTSRHRRSCRIITGHADSAVRVWDTNSGSVIKEIKGIHAGQVTSVSVAPGREEGDTLVCRLPN